MTPAAEARIREAVAALADSIIAALDDETPDAPDRLLDIRTAAEAMSIGRSALYGLIASGELRSVTVGRRRLIPADAIRRYIAERVA